ncbi:MAG: AAA family ATPase [Bacteroidia bacterium]|nr:AAA family ATPase [Bacteroidia bacterium]
MLTRVIVLNSKVYGKAEIRLDDCDSLQLVGPNNIGKSTLIYALNFLFIIDGQKMSFSGNRKGDKETIHHYFPNHNQSYIVFEIFKKSYYSIIVKRDSESNLEYYKLDSEYREEFFVDDDKRLLKFEEVKEKLTSSGLTLEMFKDKREVFQFVYQRGKRNNAVVWLDDSVRSEGLSNNFSRIYRYLINTKLITNKNLKEALIIADNRENETLNFSQKNKKDINDLKRVNNEIRNLKSVKNEFDEFRELVSQYNAKARIISELFYGFEKNYKHTMPELQVQLHEKDKAIGRLNTEMNEELIPAKAELDRKIGGKEAEINARTQQLTDKENELKEIDAFEPLTILNEQLANLDKQRKSIESRITMAELQRLNSQQIENKIVRITDQIARIEMQVKNYSNLLINKISGSVENRKLLNSILSEQVSSLPGDQVLTQIHKISQTLNLFDGKIDISKNIVIKDFRNVDELKEELTALKEEKTQQESLLKVVQDMEASNTELAKIAAQIDDIKSKIIRIKNKPNLIKSLDRTKGDINDLMVEKEKFESEQKQIAKTIARKSNELRDLLDEKQKRQERINRLIEMKHEIDELGLVGEEFETNESLDQLYNKIKLNWQDRITLKSDKDHLFEKLRDKLQSTFADEMDFIKYVEEEVVLIEDKERSVQALLESISTQFANPAYTLLKRYEEFKEFIYNKFNTKLSQTHISDIESLSIELIDNKRLVDEVRKISQIQQISGQLMFEFDNSENLKILDHYLESGQKIEFDDLFDINLHLSRKGSSKQVDLSQQIESDGTDKMIRLVIVMNIINRLSVADHENRIALFIDEVATIDKQNRPELVRFCKEHFFIPIFAAPDAVPGFGKYYFIFRSIGKININEKANAAYGEVLDKNLTLEV